MNKSIDDVQLELDKKDRFESIPKYTVHGENGEIYGTNDINDLNLLGYLAKDARVEMGCVTFSLGIMPDTMQPTGTVNTEKICGADLY